MEGYNGKYGVQFNLVTGQRKHFFESKKVELLIDMGEMSGAYMGLYPEEVWRVNPDGQIRDTRKKITNIFDMEEVTFFEKYLEGNYVTKNTSYYEKCKNDYLLLYEKMPDLPFSNDWIAKVTAPKLPENCVLHLAILNTLRSWNFFETPKSVSCFCNTGGFGIDGIVSTFAGAALADPTKLYFCVVGDLAFFYDLNAIASHNILNNLRILLINNGCGAEFKNYNHFAAQFGDDTNQYIAAMGHYGQQSPELVKNYALNLGFEYMSASNKETYLEKYEHFLCPELLDKPILFEIFTNYQDESEALCRINHIVDDNPPVPTTIEVVKNKAKELLGDKNVEAIKHLLRR